MSIELILGDCREKLKEIASDSVDLIIIDPPYLVTNEDWDKIEMINDSLVEQLFRIAKTSCSLYIWCGIGEKSQCLIKWFPMFNKKWHFKDLITWKKNRGYGARRGYLITREEIMWFVKDNKKFIWNIDKQYSNEKRVFTATYSDKEKLNKYLKSVKSPYKRISNVWTDIREPNIAGNSKEFSTVHYTPKPMKAIERMIELSSKQNDMVLDCFMGSGTTGAVCKKLKRNFIGIEINEEYLKISKERIDNTTESLF